MSAASGPCRILTVIVSNRTLRTFPCLSLFVALAALAACAGTAWAQAQFRVTWNVERTDANRVEIAGQVFNDAFQDVMDVYVTAEAFDASGKVLARGIAFVAFQLPARRAFEFSVRVPVVRGTTGYRVSVSSFRYGLGRGESP